jgi:hypothetical protein
MKELIKMAFDLKRVGFSEGDAIEMMADSFYEEFSGIPENLSHAIISGLAKEMWKEE